MEIHVAEFMIDSTIKLLRVIDRDDVYEAENILRAAKEYGVISEICKASVEQKELWASYLSRNDTPYEFLSSESTPVTRSIVKKRTQILKAMLDFGVDINAVTSLSWQTALEIIAAEKQVKMMEMMLERYEMNPNIRNSRNQTPLFAAMISESLPIVELLLSKGCDVDVIDTLGDTAFTHYIKFHPKAKKDINMIKLVLEKMGFPHINDKQGYIFNPIFVALMHISKSEGVSFDVLSILLGRQANANPRGCMDRTPLHLLCSNFSGVGSLGKLSEKTRIRFAQLFMSYQADVNVTDANKETPLHLVARTEFYKLAAELIAAGANPMAENKEGRSPKDLATGKMLKTIGKSDQDSDTDGKTKKSLRFSGLIKLSKGSVNSNRENGVSSSKPKDVRPKDNYAGSDDINHNLFHKPLNRANDNKAFDSNHLQIPNAGSDVPACNSGTDDSDAAFNDEKF